MTRDSTKYYLEIYTDKLDVPEKVIVGRFKHHVDSTFEVEIVFDSEEIILAKQRELVTGFFRSNEIMISQIYINRSFLKKLLKSESYSILLFHELGHIHFKHYLQKTDRKSLIFSGKVSTLELEADAFALNYCQAYQIVNLLKKQKAERKKINDDKSKWAIKEYDLRIKALKDMSE